MRNFVVRLYDYNDNLVDVPAGTLIAWKHALRLEAKGLRNSRGSVTKKVRATLSAPKSYSRADLIAYLEAVLDDVHGQL